MINVYKNISDVLVNKIYFQCLQKLGLTNTCIEFLFTPWLETNDWLCHGDSWRTSRNSDEILVNTVLPCEHILLFRGITNVIPSCHIFSIVALCYSILFSISIFSCSISFDQQNNVSSYSLVHMAELHSWIACSQAFVRRKKGNSWWHILIYKILLCTFCNFLWVPMDHPISLIMARKSC